MFNAGTSSLFSAIHTLENDAICDRIFGCMPGIRFVCVGYHNFLPLIASRLDSGRGTFLSLFVFAAIWLPLGTLGFDIAAN